MIGFYDFELFFVCNEDNNVYFNGVVKIRVILYEVFSILFGIE